MWFWLTFFYNFYKESNWTEDIYKKLKTIFRAYNNFLIIWIFSVGYFAVCIFLSFFFGYFPLSFFSSFFKNYVCPKFLLIKSISSCYTSVGGTLSSGSACPFIALLIWPLERQSPFAFSFDFNFLASTVGVSSSVGFL